MNALNQGLLQEPRLPRLWLRTAIATAALVAGVFGLPNAPRTRADDVTARYMDGLRQRQLFSLAEGYCLRKLSDSELPQADRLQFVLELSRTYTQHAQQTAGAEQEDLWQRARQTVLEAIATAPRDPRRPRLKVQVLLAPASQARQLRWRWELAPY